MTRVLSCGRRKLDLSRPVVMGVLNVTPDSFSDGGRYFRAGTPALDRILRRAELMLRQGAAIIDIGGESTRPGAEPVAEQEECDRVLPVVAAIAERLDVLISVDTSTPALMRDAAVAGAGMINDVRALSRPGALAALVDTDLAVCLMHMRGDPQSMQQSPDYTDVVAEVRDVLLARVAACRAAGIGPERLLIDPGFGFGKNLQHNLRLFHELDQLSGMGIPVLIGVSRKSMIKQVLGPAIRPRVAGGLALAVLAARSGASIVRTHDVAMTAEALAMVAAVMNGGSEA